MMQGEREVGEEMGPQRGGRSNGGRRWGGREFGGQLIWLERKEGSVKRAERQVRGVRVCLAKVT